MTNDFKTPTDEEHFEDLLLSIHNTTKSLGNATAMLQYYAKKLGLSRTDLAIALNMLESLEKLYGRVAKQYDNR